MKEAHHWVQGNKGLKVNSCSYGSPRVSSELPDCSMPLTFDSYNYCSLGCTYCFAYFFKTNNPSIKNNELKSVNTKNLIAALKGKPKTTQSKSFYKHFYKRKFLLHWGGLADPFCNFEKKNQIGLPLLHTLGELNYPTLFSFKGDAIFEKPYMQVFEKYANQHNFAFQVSIITWDAELAKVTEIGVPSPQKRIEAIRELSAMGYWTILRLRPYIIGITDKHIHTLLEKALEAGINAVSMEFFAMDGRANVGMKTRYDWLAKILHVEGGAKGLQKHFHALSPSERGGYMRLNRLVKEPYVKTVYKFCVDNGLVFACSDPDFKELNMSGSCCGMPDKYPPNKLLENWTRNQLTYHLKEARKKYHRTGKRVKLLFGEVYNDESYFDEKKFANDHPSVVGMDYAIRSNLTLRLILQRQWNNLRSPANPRNYLHGQVMPINELDVDGNLIFEYSPSEYEKYWGDEGIDLSI